MTSGGALPVNTLTTAQDGNSIKIVLFDIDGTLLKCGGAGKRSMVKACIEVFGTAGSMDRVDFQGKTDPYILRESLSQEGINSTQIAERLDRLTDRYVAYLDEALRPGICHALPGVSDLLQRLATMPGVILGLLTGNFVEGARVKLKRFGLERFFRFGVFGDGVYDRTVMPGIARRIARENFNEDTGYGNMIIVGDTVHDIACAKAVNAVSVCVGTGWADKETLLRENPDFFFDDLTDGDAFIDSLL